MEHDWSVKYPVVDSVKGDWSDDEGPVEKLLVILWRGRIVVMVNVVRSQGNKLLTVLVEMLNVTKAADMSPHGLLLFTLCTTFLLNHHDHKNSCNGLQFWGF